MVLTSVVVVVVAVVVVTLTVVVGLVVVPDPTVDVVGDLIVVVVGDFVVCSCYSFGCSRRLGCSCYSFGRSCCGYSLIGLIFALSNPPTAKIVNRQIRL